MTSYSFGGSVTNTSFTGYPGTFIYHDGNGAPTTNLAFNGNRPITINSISPAQASGAGGIYGFIDYQGSGGVTSGTWANSGGSFRFGIGYSSGTLSFGRNNAGGGTVEDAGDGTNWTGSLPGSFQYYGAPTAPLSVTASASATVSGRIVVSWSAPSDNGGTSITGYDIYTGATLLGSVGAVTTFNADGLTPGTAYTFTVRAKNSVTTSAGTTSVASSASSSVTAPGAPTAPTSPSATPSTTVVGRIDLSWSAPATPGTGGITGYNIFNSATNVQIGSTTGTGTTFAATGYTGGTSRGFYIKARNAFADANGVLSDASSTVSATDPQPPSAPQTLTAVASGVVAGKITLTWVAPATPNGTITGYMVYFSTNVVIATVGNVLTYDVTGLNPGQTYSFYVKARNAIADASGQFSVASNTATETALGEPAAPTSMTATASTVVPGRISLSWVAPAGVITGYSVFDYNTTTLVDTLIAVVQGTSYKIDSLAAGVAKTYRVRARNAYTDTLGVGYPGNYGGAVSTSASATPLADYTVPVATVAALSNSTNIIFNGTYTINAVTPTTVRYAKTNANITTVATSSGTITDNTNATFNGTYAIASTPTPSTFTYSKTASNIASTAVSGGVITNSTNAIFNGTYTVTAVNVGAKTVSYAKTNANITTRAVPVNTAPGAFSVVSNNTNAVFNGTGLTITSATSYTISYAKTNANIAESNAAGTVTDTTNRDDYNGLWTIASIPSHNSVTYVSAGASQSAITVPSSPSGQVSRHVSPASLDIEYRSGWVG